MRKAGGTVIRKYLQQVAKTHGLEYQAREGRKTVEHPIRPGTLYVTNLREPNARTISHYKYDQRWSCTKLRKSSFIPSLNNTRSSFEHFLHSNDKHTSTSALWACATNCYTRWATGNYKPLSNTCSNKLGRDEITRIQEARDQLLQYHLIIVSEWLRDPHYIHQVENMFGVQGLAGKKVYPICAKASARANEEIPLVITNETLTRLQDCNMPDTALYRQLTFCPNDGLLDFPLYNRSLFA